VENAGFFPTFRISPLPQGVDSKGQIFYIILFAFPKINVNAC